MIIAILIAFFALLFLGMPIAFTIGIVSAGVLLFSGISLEIMVQRMFAGVNNFSYLALPLFILAGNIMGEGGLTKRLMALADAIVGRFSGGLRDDSSCHKCFLRGCIRFNCRYYLCGWICNCSENERAKV